MSEPKVVLATADYISTPDINLALANDAHLHQSKGNSQAWYQVDFNNPDQSADLTPVIGDYHGAANPQNNVSAAYIRTSGATTDGIAAAAATTYTSSYAVSSDQEDMEAHARIVWYTAAGALISESGGDWVAIPQNDLSTLRVSVTAVAPGTTAFAVTVIVYRAASGNLASTDNLYWDAHCFNEGASAVFVASLNVDGTLGETVDPSGMDVDFVAGQDLRIGDGWAGDAVSYERRDGTTGPVVAYWSAQETVDGAGLQIGDTDTYVGDTDGRTWALNGADSAARWDNLEQQGTDAVMSHLHNLDSPPESGEVVGALNEMIGTDGIGYRSALRQYLNLE